MSRAYELAKRYYPTMWSIERLEALVMIGQLTQAEFDEITSQG